MRFGIQMMAADAGMDTTCPSPEIPNDSRKRPLDAESDNGSTKRSHFSGESQAKQTKNKNLLLMLKKIRKKVKFDDIDVVLHVQRARQLKKRIITKKDK
jgi:hypothetical protein